jgi:opacity protein-like surface antigen
MKRTLFASALLLLLAGSASAADLTATSNAPVSGGAQSVEFTPKPTPAAACTVSCWTDPSITCTSQAGSCSTGGFWGVYWITCDGVRHMCPEL